MPVFIRKRGFYGAVITFLLVSCGEKAGTISPVKPNEKVRVFAFEYEAVWKAVMTYLESEKTDILTQDKDAGTIVTPTVPIDPQSPFGKHVLVPESGERHIQLGTYELAITLKKLGERSTQIDCDVRVKKFSRGFFRYFKWRTQPSNGYIEQIFFTQIGAILKG